MNTVASGLRLGLAEAAQGAPIARYCAVLRGYESSYEFL